jgi:hypothetical protein
MGLVHAMHSNGPLPQVFFMESGPCGPHIKIALSWNWTRFSMAEPIATVSGALYHCTIVACYILQTCAIYVTCGLIGKHIYFYSIWDIWYISWTSFSMWIQWWCPFFNENSVMTVIMSFGDYILITYDMVITKHHFQCEFSCSSDIPRWRVDSFWML